MANGTTTVEVKSGYGLDIDTELVLPEPRGDIRVCVSVNIGIDAQGDRGQLAHLARDPVDTQEFCFRFDIETADAGLQCTTHFIGALADTGEHHPRRIAACLQDALQFTDRNNVEAGSEARQDLQHRQAGIRLDRVADEVGSGAERRVEDPPVMFQGCA